MFFPSRRPRGPDRFLSLKIALLAVGASLVLVGGREESRVVVYVGIALLAVAFLLRFVRSGER